MSVVLDTHVWIWWLIGQSALSDKERLSLDALAATELPILPGVCLWEAQMLHAKGRLELDRPLDRWLREASQPAVIRLAPLSVEVVLAVDALPASFHGDPADRLIVGTARALDLRLATHDKAIRRSRLVKLWRS